jgi:hypothetical protein
MPNQNSIIIEAWSDNLTKLDFVHGHMGFECDTCGLIPETIYCCWFKDYFKNRLYLRFLCTSCKERVLNSGVDGYLKNYLDLLGVQAVCSFPGLDKIRDARIVAKNFIINAQNECYKKT